MNTFIGDGLNELLDRVLNMLDRDFGARRVSWLLGVDAVRTFPTRGCRFRVPRSRGGRVDEYDGTDTTPTDLLLKNFTVIVCVHYGNATTVRVKAKAGHTHAMRSIFIGGVHQNDQVAAGPTIPSS